MTEKREAPPIPVDPLRYPVIWWYCAVTREELQKMTLDLSKFADPFELRERLRAELAQLMKECEARGRKRK